ncbi:hypothetical protein U1763_01420 [Sphingomonas sp. LB2R24]|jgi:hypothetical protein|uniref:hypothetical protein n=1 Tax=Sphingomonas TaxID=13687 RepID=UPI00140447DB|nr:MULTISPECIES: hypothetical protein [Sphingomonas]
MARQQDIFTLVGNRMRAPAPCEIEYPAFERPPIADLIRRIDQALEARRAA